MTALWMASICGSALLAITMAATGSCRRWPSLFLYLLCIVGQSGACWALWASHAYFWAYYGFNLAEQVCQLWATAQIIRAAIGVTAPLRKWSTAAVIVLALCLLAIAYLDSGPVTIDGARFIVMAARRLDLAVSTAWCLTLLAVVVSSRAIAELSGGLRGVCAGFIVEMGGSQLVTAVNAFYPALPHLADIRGCVYLFSLATWAVTLSPRPASLMQHFVSQIKTQNLQSGGIPGQ